MYGLVNKAVEDLVVTNFGEDKWEAIKLQAGVDAIAEDKARRKAAAVAALAASQPEGVPPPPPPPSGLTGALSSVWNKGTAWWRKDWEPT